MLSFGARLMLTQGFCLAQMPQQGAWRGGARVGLPAGRFTFALPRAPEGLRHLKTKKLQPLEIGLSFNPGSTEILD